jgi:AAA+ superfamily predicted ATPase
MTSPSVRPAWYEEIGRHFLSGSSHFFILHGNVDDVVAEKDDDGKVRVEAVTDFLARRAFGAYDLVLHYDLGRGLRLHPAGNRDRETRMRDYLGSTWPGVTRPPQEPTPLFRLLDRLVTRLVDEAETGLGRRAAFLFDYAELLAPAEGREPEHLAALLNWARSPKVRAAHIVILLLTTGLSRIHTTLVGSGYSTEIRLPLPDRDTRKRFIEVLYPDRASEADRLAGLTSGLTLMNLGNLVRMTGWTAPVEEKASGGPLPRVLGDLALPPAEPPALDGPTPSEPSGAAGDAELMRLKKQLIEAQTPGLLEFVEPKMTLDLVAGHHAAKTRLAQDARLVAEGQLEAVPMGYLLSGPVGSGKTFLATCYAGSVGIPSVTLKNFRSKYVGETEANLERILGVLKELGPVAVIIDEADAAVGDRNQEGDAGTSSRVFAQLAGQMGDTRQRGKTIWFLLTCRPDLLPIDLKRQGRCEEHIPLFYPETTEERREMFQAMAKKLGLDIGPDQIPDLPTDRSLSGADIESLLTRARREALVTQRPLDKALLSETLARFHSARSPEHELQILAAVLECSDHLYLPDVFRKAMETEAGRADLTARLYLLKSQFDR